MDFDPDDFRPRYYDRDGVEIEGDDDVEMMRKWGTLRMDEDYLRVGRDHFPLPEDEDGIMVSTVWFGLDMRIMPPGPPLIFETMIFGGPLDQEQWRYSTLEQAEAGHKAAVNLVLIEMQVAT